MRRTALKYISPRTNGLKLMKNETFFGKQTAKVMFFLKQTPSTQLLQK